MYVVMDKECRAETSKRKALHIWLGMEITPDLYGNTVLHCLQEGDLDIFSNRIDYCFHMRPDEAIWRHFGTNNVIGQVPNSEIVELPPIIHSNWTEYSSLVF
jgi:hypothetical protein